MKRPAALLLLAALAARAVAALNPLPEIGRAHV